MIGGLSMERIALQKLIDWNNSKRKKPLIIIPGGYKGVDELLAEEGTKVIMKSASELENVIETIKEKNIENKASIVQNCGLENEKIVKNINDEINSSYFTTILIKE